MKKSILFLMLMGLTGMAYANCGNDNGNGNGCSGDVGPQGPAGLKGTNGTNGVNGINGKNGVDGKNGTNAQIDDSAKLALDTAVRLYDGKRIQFQLFNIYQPSRKDKQDVLGDGKNFMFGARIIVKLGSSYEERQNEELKHQLEALERMIAKRK